MLSFLRGVCAPARRQISTSSFDPSEGIANLKYLYDMDHSIITQNAGVDQVSDISGNDDHLILVTANKATHHTNVINGNSVLRHLSNAACSYDNSSYQASSTTTQIIVHRGLNNDFGIFGGFAGGNARIQTNASNQAAWDRAQSGGNAAFAVNDTQSFNIYMMEFIDNVTLNIYVNGTLITSFDPDNQYIGLKARLFHSHASDHEIAFCAGIDGVLQDSEKNELITYLKERYAIA